MTRRATVRTATAPALRGQPVSIEGEIEYVGRSLLRVRPRLNVTVYGLVVLFLLTVRRMVRWCWRWRDRTAPLALGALLDLFWWPTWAAAAATLTAGSQSRRVFPRARRGRDMYRISRRWGKKCRKIKVNPVPDILTFGATDVALKLKVLVSEETKAGAFVAMAPQLRTAYRAHHVDIVDKGHGRYTVTIWWRDLLSIEPEWTPLTQVVDTAIPLGIDRHGTEICAPIRGAHWLIAGTTGSGKSTTINALMAHLVAVPNIQLWGLDAKRGATMKGWEPVLHRLAVTPDAAVAALEELVGIIDSRNDRLVDGLFRTTPNEPLIVCVVDEMRRLFKRVDDEKAGKRAQILFSDAISQGRSARVHLIAATQYPSAVALGGDLRSNFTHTICLRVRTVQDSNVALGPGVKGMGWNAATISADHPGRAIYDNGAVFSELRTYRLWAVDKFLGDRYYPFDVPGAAVSVRTDGESPGYTSSDQGVSRPTDVSVRTDDPLVVLVDAGNTRERCVAALVEAGPRGVEAQSLADRWGITPKSVRRQLVAAGGVSKGGRYYRREDLP